MGDQAGTEDWSGWIGRRTVREDIATPRLAAEFRATLEPWLFRADDPLCCPPGLHWALAPATPGMAALDGDGSEAKGIFLPPLALPRRMWAGGMIETLAPIVPGAAVRRVSTLAGIKQRGGKSGDLCFVSIRHEIESAGRLALRERQDLVFRAAQSLTAAAPPAQAPLHGLQWRVDPSPALLFRFSALTFNGHRIHYDEPYARAEGYDGLVVHGPLQAALMLNQAATVLGRVPECFEYRCLTPLLSGAPFIASSASDGPQIVSRITAHDGVTTAEGRVRAPET